MIIEQQYLDSILREGMSFKDVESYIEDYLFIKGRSLNHSPAYIDPTPYMQLSEAEEIVRKIDSLNPRMIKNHGICYAWSWSEGLNFMSQPTKDYMKAIGRRLPGFLEESSYWFQKDDFAARLQLLMLVREFLSRALSEVAVNLEAPSRGMKEVLIAHKHVEDVTLWEGITLEEAKAFKKLCLRAMKELQKFSGLYAAFKCVVAESPDILPEFGKRHMDYLKSIAKKLDEYRQDAYWFRTGDKEPRQKVLTTAMWELDDFIRKTEKSQTFEKEVDPINPHKRLLLILRDSIEEVATIIDDYLKL